MLFNHINVYILIAIPVNHHNSAPVFSSSLQRSLQCSQEPHVNKVTWGAQMHHTLCAPQVQPLGRVCITKTTHGQVIKTSRWSTCTLLSTPPPCTSMHPPCPCTPPSTPSRVLLSSPWFDGHPIRSSNAAWQPFHVTTSCINTCIMLAHSSGLHYSMHATFFTANLHMW